MIETIKKIALDVIHSIGPVSLSEATVVSAPPNLSIKLKEDEKLIIPKDLIIVAESLTAHKRTASINGSVATIEFTDELKVGDPVMVISLQGGQKFYIADRLRTY